MFNETLIVIPSRSGSKGIKNKNFIKIKGLSLLERAIIFSQKLLNNKKIYVSSDSTVAKNICALYKVNFIQRPKILSGDRISDYRVIRNVLLNKNIKNKNYRFLIYLQPTSPLRDLVEIKKNLTLIKKNNYDAIFSVTKIAKSFHPLKVFKKNKNNFLNLFIAKGKNIIARQQLKNVYIRNGLFYIFNIKRLLKKKTIYLPKIYCYESLRDTINIDTQKDLKFFRQNI